MSKKSAEAYDAFLVSTEYGEHNNLSFIWSDEPANPEKDETKRQAFIFAGAKEILLFEKFDIFRIYYITDVPQVDGADFRSLSMKYPGQVNSMLQKDKVYYLCLV